MIRWRSLFAVLLSLLLLGAQQVAFAHMIGHVGASAAAVAVATDDEGHGEALGLSHVCTTCVSLSALDAGAPPGVSPRLTFDGGFASPMHAIAAAIAAAHVDAYLARAPPTVL